MIFDSIKNKEFYKGMPRIYEALEFLETLTPDTLPEKRVDFEQDEYYVLPKRYDTVPEQDIPFEVHHARLDIHYMLEGCEGVQSVDETDPSVKPLAEFREDKDIGRFNAEPDGTYWLRPGYFALSLPGEVHKTGFFKDQPIAIKKAIVKITVREGVLAE
jgi:biofilm protein TabA